MVSIVPLTPIHGLVVLPLYFRKKAKFDPLALVASATIIDLEPLYYGLSGSTFTHRIFHGYALTLTIYPLLVCLAVYFAERFLEQRLWSVYSFLRLKPEKVRYSLLTVYVCCLIGGLSHVFFDMFTHEIMPYVVYPLFFGNPFYLGQASGVVELTVVALACYSVFCWFKNAKAE